MSHYIKIIRYLIEDPPAVVLMSTFTIIWCNVRQDYFHFLDYGTPSDFFQIGNHKKKKKEKEKKKKKKEKRKTWCNKSLCTVILQTWVTFANDHFLINGTK